MTDVAARKKNALDSVHEWSCNHRDAFEQRDMAILHACKYTGVAEVAKAAGLTPQGVRKILERHRNGLDNSVVKWHN